MLFCRESLKKFGAALVGMLLNNYVASYFNSVITSCKVQYRSYRKGGGGGGNILRTGYISVLDYFSIIFIKWEYIVEYKAWFYIINVLSSFPLQIVEQKKMKWEEPIFIQFLKMMCVIYKLKKILFKKHFYEKKAIYVFTSGGRYGMFFKSMLQISDPIK